MTEFRVAIGKRRAFRRRLADALAHGVAIAGGLATVLGIGTMMLFLTAEVAPLWQGARVQLEGRVPLGEQPSLLWVSTDEYRELVQAIRADGSIEWRRVADGRLVHNSQLPGTEGLGVEAVQSPRSGQVVYWRSDGVLVAAKVVTQTEYTAAGRALRPETAELGRWNLLPPGQTPRLFSTGAYTDKGMSAAWLRADGAVEWWSVREQHSLLGGGRQVEMREVIRTADGARVQSLVLNHAGNQLLMGTDEGTLEVWQRGPSASQLIDRRRAADRASISVLAFLLGERAVAVGDSAGGVSVWQLIRDPQTTTGHRLVRIHSVRPHQAPVVQIARSERDRSFVSADSAGTLLLRHSTSEQTLAEIPAGSVRFLAFAPKGDGLLQITLASEARAWRLENPHPEVTLKTLFGKVWYEGYDEPAYVWQSTGGTDDFEPKLSLVPLVFGTVKGTLYALLFSVPISLLAALYVSQFSPPRLRSAIKPVVEIMAALPSVVLGFVAGLVLAPAVEKHIVGVLMALPLAPLSVFSAGLLWHACPAVVRARMPHGGEVVVASVFLAMTGYFFWVTSAYWEQLLFAGDFRHWISEVGLGRFDQRNCLVVGLAMGFAVIPIIFTIAEDALANVPQRLVSASLALGATRWQTAVRVVLPAASPGIFSAIMIGFGRAVGETMIVLMATGNTPVLDWSVFTGMRTLSANIAVEIPEAPFGGTLYRVLFLAALMLFVITFIANTLAEVVRQRLRERYQRL